MCRAESPQSNRHDVTGANKTNQSAAAPWLVRCGLDVPIEIIGGNGPIDTRPKERAFIAALVLAHPRPVDISVAINAMWPDVPPTTARASLHNHIGRLRRMAPDLIVSNHSGYQLDDARVELPGERLTDHSRRLIELDSAFDIDHARHTFEEQSTGSEDFAATVRREDDGSLLAALHEAVAVEPLDERAWWKLMVAQAAAGDHRSVRSSLERARGALELVGLDPSRRLDDIERLASGGVTDITRLLADGFGEAQAARFTFDDVVDDRFDEARDSLARELDLRIDIVGNDTAERRTTIAGLVEEARVGGFGTIHIRCDADGVCPDLPDVSWPPHRPTLVVVDRAETSTLGASLHARVRSAIRSKLSPATPVAVAITTAQTLAPGPEGEHEAEHAIRLDVDATTGDATASVAPVALGDMLPDVVHFAALIALIDHPVLPSDLTPIEPAAADLASYGIRSGLFRHDARLGHVDMVDPSVAADILSRLDTADTAAAARLLLTTDLADDTPLRAVVRRARLSALTAEPPSAETLASARAASEAVIATGDFGGGAAMLTRLLDPIENSEGRSSRWCDVAFEAGRAAITAGIVDGEQLLLAVIDAGRLIGQLDVVVSAVLELCRLGPGSMAGDHDASMRSLINALMPEVTGFTLRARLGGAASMVLSFANEPDLLRQMFDAAEADARAAEDADVLVDVLPFTYMSLPLPSDLARRESNAADLERAATLEQRSDGLWEAAQLRLSNQILAGSGDIRATQRTLEQHARELHERSRSWEMHYLRSNLALIDGDFDEARRHIDASLGFTGDVHSSRIDATFGANHLAIALADGTVGAFLDTVRALAHNQPEIGGWAAAHALCAAEAQELDEAIAAFDAWHKLHERQPIRDHTYTVSALAIGEAAVRIGKPEIVNVATTLLEPFAGSWTWCGSCTFGPIDLTLARLHAVSGDRAKAIRAATSALASSADLRAPAYSAAATAVLLGVAD